jgi:hypothetical protein
VYKLVGVGDQMRFATSLVTNEPLRRNDRPFMRPILRIEFADRLIPPFHDTVDSMKLAARIIADGSRFIPSDATPHVHMDQFSEHAYRGILASLHARSHYHNLNVNTKGAACTLLQQYLDDGVICIDDSPAADALAHELEVYQQVMTSGGSYRYSAPAGSTDDILSCCLQASLSMLEDNRFDRIGWQAARGVVR